MFQNITFEKYFWNCTIRIVFFPKKLDSRYIFPELQHSDFCSSAKYYMQHSSCNMDVEVKVNEYMLWSVRFTLQLPPPPIHPLPRSHPSQFAPVNYVHHIYATKFIFIDVRSRVKRISSFIFAIHFRLLQDFYAPKPSLLYTAEAERKFLPWNFFINFSISIFPNRFSCEVQSNFHITDFKGTS